MTTEIPVTQDTIYMCAAVAAGTSEIMLYLQSQFREQKKLIFETRRIFYRVISLHNKEDDDRFELVNDGIWKILVRNATKDGDVFPEPSQFRRRRYLAETLTEDGDEIAA